MSLKKWETFEHTADLGLHVYGADLRVLFGNAAAALTFQIAGDSAIRESGQRTIALEEEGDEELFRSWLAEILYLFNSEGWLCASARIDRLAEGCLEAVLEGEKLDEDRHTLELEIKAVTWHGLSIERDAESGVLRATVIFDI